MVNKHYYKDADGFFRLKPETDKQRKGRAKHLRRLRQCNHLKLISRKKKHGRSTKVSLKGVS